MDPDSWRDKPIVQQPKYADALALNTALDAVRSMPPLVNHGEVDALRAHLAKAARGEAFLLQGGDCAERFADCRKAAIEAKLKILLQMSLVLTWGARIPVIRVGRMAANTLNRAVAIRKSPMAKNCQAIEAILLTEFKKVRVIRIQSV